MASHLSAVCFGFRTSTKLNLLLKPANVQNVGITTFPGNIKTSRFSIRAAKADTVDKICGIVKEQLALSADITITPQSKFSELGADSLDTVEIVMKLEEAFDICVEDENSDNITTIQEVADLVDKLVETKLAAT